MFFRLGAHLPVKVEKINEYPQVALLYKAHIGAYHKINDVIVEVEQWALEQNLPCKRTFGEYLDDPKTQEEARLRSHGGCVLDGIQSVTMTKEALPGGYIMRTLESRPYVKAEFEGAPSISPFKVYPKAMEFIEENRLEVKGAVLEIYSFQGERKALTEYLFPVSSP